MIVNIQIYGDLSMYFSTSQKSLYFLPPSRLFAYLDFSVLKKKRINFIFDYLPGARLCKICLGRIRDSINQVSVA